MECIQYYFVLVSGVLHNLLILVADGNIWSIFPQQVDKHSFYI